MTKDEALRLALEALEWMVANDDTNEGDEPVERLGGQSWNEYNAYWLDGLNKARASITAIKQALAAPVQEPVCDKDPQGCWSVRCQLGKKCKNTPPAQPAPVQEPVGALILGGVIDTSDGPEYEEWDVEWNTKAVEALQEKLVTSNSVTVMIYTTPPAQPAVPDAFGTREGEHPQYIQGWNDCRAEMLKARSNT